MCIVLDQIAWLDSYGVSSLKRQYTCGYVDARRHIIFNFFLLLDAATNTNLTVLVLT